MKLRIQDNTLRFRLTQGEVARLKEGGRVEAEVRFTPDRALQYSVCSSQSADGLEVDYAADQVRVVLPRRIAVAWADSDQVTITGPGRVQVLVEKDFKCLHRGDRSEPDAWPNPLAEQYLGA